MRDVDRALERFVLQPIYQFGKEGHELQFRWEAFNVVNHPRWGLPNTSVTSTYYGRIISTNGTMRQMQFALKYVF